jgi:hypothetical protein
MYTKQPQIIESYKKLGLSYPEEVSDWLHEGKFMSQTAKSPEQCNFCTITTLIRLQTHEGKEYLVYSLTYHRTDSIGNIRHSFLPKLGVGPKLQPVKRIRKDENGYEEPYIARANIVADDYYIPYTGPESIKTLLKKLEKGEGAIIRLDTEEGRKKSAADQERREKWAAEHGKIIHNAEKEITQLLIQREGDRRKHHVLDFESFLSSSFEDLISFGKTPTDKERADRLAAEEVLKAQRSLASIDANLASELERARRLGQEGGIPYK